MQSVYIMQIQTHTRWRPSVVAINWNTLGNKIILRYYMYYVFFSELENKDLTHLSLLKKELENKYLTKLSMQKKKKKKKKKINKIK